MPFGSFLGLAIFSATTRAVPALRHAARGRGGQTPLEDQALAGGIMWAGGDAVFLVALITAIVAWLRSEEAEGRRVDTLLDHEAAQTARRAAREVAPTPPESMPAESAPQP